MVGYKLLSMVPKDLMREIVKLVAGGKDDKVEEKLRALRPLSEASRLTKESTMGLMGYVMSLAPARAVPTSVLLKRMSDREFAAEVVNTAKKRKSSALMLRIADLAADRNGAPVADALRDRLGRSIREATVNGKLMYGDDSSALDKITTETIDRLKQKGGFDKPDIDLSSPVAFWNFIREFMALDVPERIEHMRKYGPMCMWDVSGISSFLGSCSKMDVDLASFNSDLYWNTSSATGMGEMFRGNSEFRGDLSTWDVSKVASMSGMFRKAGIENSGIGSWNLASLEYASEMFLGAVKLSPALDLSRWNVQHCHNLSDMFKGSKIEDSGIGQWTLHPEANTRRMLKNATSFRGDLSKWPDDKRTAAEAPAIAPVPVQRFGAVQGTVNDAVVTAHYADALREAAEQETGGCAVQ